MNIEDTFGYQLAESRVAKGWTERDVAEAINKAPRKTSRPFTAQSVIEWQELKTVPSKEIVEILAIKLIDQNSGLDETRKEAMRDAFVKAADRDREALARGEDLHDLFLEGRSPFGQMLNAMRTKNNLNEVQLAILCEEQELIEPVTTERILRLQFGLEKPSPALAKCIADVMNLNLAEVVETVKPTFVTMVAEAEGHPQITAANETGQDFELEAARIGKELQQFFTKIDELALLPPCMKPTKRGNGLPSIPGSEKVPYEEGGTATARVISAIHQQLNERGAVSGPAKLVEWLDISRRWRELAESYQNERREAGVENTAAIG